MGSLLGTDIDDKKFRLGVMIGELRNHIDVYRVIGINFKEIQKAKFSPSILGYMQHNACMGIAIGVTKMFEQSAKHPLNSIPSIIKSIDGHSWDSGQIQSVENFGVRFGNNTKCTNPTKHLQGTLKRFCKGQRKSLDSLKCVRNQFAAHSQYKVPSGFIPSFDDIEAIYQFSWDFYEFVTEELMFHGAGPAPRKVGHALCKLFKVHKVENVKFDFD